MTDGPRLWETLATELTAADAAVTRSTMMGYPCLRYDGAFFASLDMRTGGLIVKLAADEVAIRVADGRGRPFAPAGRAFREWLSIVDLDEDGWRRAIAEALAFVRVT